MVPSKKFALAKIKTVTNINASVQQDDYFREILSNASSSAFPKRDHIWKRFHLHNFTTNDFRSIFQQTFLPTCVQETTDYLHIAHT